MATVESRRFLSLATAPAKLGQSVPSPCINVCRMSQATGLCEGCWRTLDELRLWSQSDDGTKREIWHRVEQRQIQAGQVRT